jgi:chromosome segregation ATPase
MNAEGKTATLLGRTLSVYEQKVCDVLVKQNISLNGQKSSLLSEIQTLKAEQDELSKAIDQAKQSKMDDVNLINEKKTSLEAVLSDLEDSIALKRTELSAVEGELANKRVDLESVKAEVAALVSNRTQTLADYDTQLQKKKEAVEKEIAEKEAQWVEKSGELSLRERQIEQVTLKLQVAKRKLEEQYGRQFNEIII